MKRPARAGLKRPAAPKDDAEEVAEEKDPMDSKEECETTEPEPENGEAEMNNVGKRIKKKDGDEKPNALPTDKGGKKAAIIESKIEYKGGWILYQMKTPQGRVYPKYVGPDGGRYSSLKKAQESGFKV